MKYILITSIVCVLGGCGVTTTEEDTTIEGDTTFINDTTAIDTTAVDTTAGYEVRP